MGALAMLMFLLFITQSGGAAPAPAPAAAPPTPKPPARPPAAPLAPMPPWPTPKPAAAAKPKPAAAAAPKPIPVSTGPSPAGLPKFPAGWEPDTPPSSAVVARAYALLPTLWKSGKPGAIKQEQTAGQWKTYQAYSPSKGKRSVVAYRPKGGGGTVYS
jgi:hypothetical protein